MDKEQLHSTLEQLHNELQQIESVDKHERQILQKLSRDIEKLTGAETSNQKTSYDSLGEALREAVQQLEASHPQLTILMGRVIDALAKMGI